MIHKSANTAKYLSRRNSGLNLLSQLFIHKLGTIIGTISLVGLNLFNLSSSISANALPLRGPQPWSIIMCKYSDSEIPRKNPTYFRDLILRRSPSKTMHSTIGDFWHQMSHGNISFSGSVVRGWYIIPMTVEVARKRSRDQQFNDCVNAAKKSRSTPHHPPANQHILVITSPSIDLFALNGKRVFISETTSPTLIAHEMGHALGLKHSFSDDPKYRNASWSQIGEYDDEWDIMSAAHVFSIKVSPWGWSGPGLNAHKRDRMGWLPRRKIVTFGADEVSSQIMRVGSLTYPNAPGSQLIRVPFDPSDPYRYYTIEYRSKDGWDSGIPQSTILIHEVKRNKEGQYNSYLLRERKGARKPLQSISRNGVIIRTIPSNNPGKSAVVSISSKITKRCLQGYVWREANSRDKVCVKPGSRFLARKDNRRAARRRNPEGGPYGPNTCKQGFVWREAFRGDQICVTPTTRKRTHRENQLAAQRRNPARFVYGPNTCKKGYVWREAHQYDWLCVRPHKRR